MITKPYKNLALFIPIVMIVVLVIGLFGNQRGAVVNASSSLPSTHKSSEQLVITQGNTIHLSTRMGEEVSFPLEVEDPQEGQSYTWRVVTPPVQGEIFLDQKAGNVLVTYTPAPSFTGSDLATVTVNDLSGNQGRIGIVINVLPVPSGLDSGLGVESLTSIDNSSGRFPIGTQSLANEHVPPMISPRVKPADQPVPMELEENEFFTIDEVKLPGGEVIHKFSINGPPALPTDMSAQMFDWTSQQGTAEPVMLSNVPAYTWVFGSSAVSAAMIAGYYDNTGFPNLYTGPSNGGLSPLLDTIWPKWTDGALREYPNNPLVASHNGLDGRVTRGSIDDYWVEFDSPAVDPYITNLWTEHTWGDAVGDYMKTSQSAYGNKDGATTFHSLNSSPDHFSCEDIESQGLTSDGTLGIRQFYEARGYQTSACYLQKTDNQVAGGFSLNQYRAEINAGFPVMIHLTGHTVVGVGYDPASNMIFIHDTWSAAINTMDWGESYIAEDMWAVSIVHIGTPVVPGNDLITSPKLITDFPADFTQDTSLATSSLDDPDLSSCGSMKGEASVWYKYSPVSDGVLALDTFGSDYDTILGVWSGSPGSLTNVACNNDYEGTQSKVSLRVTGGVDYYVGIFQNSNTINLLTANGGTLYLHAENTVTTHPIIDVAPVTDVVWGDKLMSLTTVTLRIGSFVTSKVSGADGRVAFKLTSKVNIVPGSVITLDDGFGSTTHTVTSLGIKSVDELADDIVGTAAPLSEVEVYACNLSTCEWLNPVTDLQNDWAADFSSIPFDLVSGVSGWASQQDAIGNRTCVYWKIPNPYITAYPDKDKITGNNWTPYTNVKLIINETVIATKTSDANGFVKFNTTPLNIIAGQVIKLTDGKYLRKHTVTDLSIFKINTVADRIKGNAAPGSIVTAMAWNPISFIGDTFDITTGSDGVWLADFSGKVDIAPGSEGFAVQSDLKGNATRIDWYLPNPRIGVNFLTDQIYGLEWTPGANVTLSVGMFSASTTATTSGYISFHLAGFHDLVPGEEVVVTDGITTKSHIIRNLGITGFDETGEIITGTTNSDLPVMVAAIDINSVGMGKQVIPDGLGNWSADFSGHIDIGPGTWGWVEQGDGDGDRTEIEYDLPDVPELTSLTKPFGVVGQPSVTLYLNGSNFVPTSTAWYNGVERATTFISSDQLSIQLSEADLASAGDFSVTVVTPPPGGGTSETMYYQVIGTTPAYDGKLTSNYAVFYWDDIAGATTYKFQMSALSDFSVLLVNTSTASSYYNGYLTPLPRGTTYYWRVRPFYGGVKGAWSVALPFNTQDPLAAPVLGEVTKAGYMVTMNWSSVEGAVTYKVQVSDNAAFTTLVLNESVTTISKELVLPETAKTYYWRVRAFDGDKFKSPWSSGTFVVP